MKKKIIMMSTVVLMSIMMISTIAAAKPVQEKNNLNALEKINEYFENFDSSLENKGFLSSDGEGWLGALIIIIWSILIFILGILKNRNAGN